MQNRKDKNAKECEDCLVSMSYEWFRYLFGFWMIFHFGFRPNFRASRGIVRRDFLQLHYNMWIPQVRAFRGRFGGAILL